MEMRRCAKENWLKRNLFSWEAWYKYISLYGQSAKRAFWGIILILLVGSIIVALDPNINNMKNFQILNPGFDDVIIFVKFFINAIKYNLFCLIHPAEWTLKDKISLTAFITAWERILIILIGAFFMLALRRRFRRA